MILSFEGKKPEIHQDAYVSPDVSIIGNVTVEQNASIWFQSVLRGDINSIFIGESSNIQDACILHVTNKFAVSVGKRVTVGHKAILHGCTVGDNCLIAMGAILLDGAIIEDNCIVGAGSLVPPGMKILSGSLVLGNPAKIVRVLTDQDLERIEKGWQNYMQYAQRYKKELGSIS